MIAELKYRFQLSAAYGSFSTQSLNAIQSALSQRLDEAKVTFDPDLTSSVVNAVSVNLNFAYCSFAPDCNYLNRTHVVHACLPILV